MEPGFKLHDGTMLSVHPQRYCKPPCAFHEPLPGPWEDWSLAWEYTPHSDDEKIVLRICKHGVRHPAVEQFPHWVEQGDVTRARHTCCGCPCVPDGVLGSNLRILISEEYVAAMEADEKAVDALDPGPRDLSPFIKVGAPEIHDPKKWSTEKDPNRVAENYLAYIRPNLDGELHKALVLLCSQHVITGVESIASTGSRFTHLVECEMNCCDHFKQGDTATDDDQCVTLKFAILGGYVPVEWSVDGDDDEEDDD